MQTAPATSTANLLQRQDVATLLLLAAIWGGTYLLLRLGAGAFGAVPLAGLRAALAVVALLPLVVWRGEWPALRRHWKPIFLVGLTNSALPFACFSFAAGRLSVGLCAVLSAATPLFGALIAWGWLGQRVGGTRLAGLLIGLAGVFGLALDRMDAARTSGAFEAVLAVGACLLATIGYGFSTNFTKKYLQGVPPLASAAGSQVSAALALAGPALWLWPQAAPGATAWGMAAVLAVVCTGLAYVLFFRLIARAGAANAMTVTYLIPVFGMAWGALFLGELPSPAMLAGCAVIFAGTALALRAEAAPAPGLPGGAVSAQRG